MRAGGTAGDARAALGGSSPQPGQLGLRPAGSDGGGGGRRGCTAAGHQPCSATGPPPRPSPHGHHHLPGPAVSSLPLPPVAHPCALVTVPRAPSRASWGGGGDPHYTGGASGAEDGEREPLAAPPSPLVSLQAGRQRTRPAPAYSSARLPGAGPLRRERGVRSALVTRTNRKDGRRGQGNAGRRGGASDGRLEQWGRRQHCFKLDKLSRAELCLRSIPS